MRSVAVFMLICAAAGAFAQSPQLIELPPPAIEGPDEPAVRIPEQQGDRIEEVRVGGRVVMLKVTPPGGATYYLVDSGLPRDTLDDGVRVPMWPVYTFD